MGLPWVYPCISYQSYHFTSGSSLWVAEEVGRVEHRGERSHRMHPIQRPGDRNTGQLVGWQKNTTQHTLNIYFCWILLANVDILYAWLVVANFRKGNCWVWLLVKWILAVPANDAISLDRWWQFGKVAILGSVAKTESANIPILWWLCPKNIRIWESSHAGDKKKTCGSNSHPIWMTAFEIRRYQFYPRNCLDLQPIQPIYWNMLNQLDGFDALFTPSLPCKGEGQGCDADENATGHHLPRHDGTNPD